MAEMRQWTPEERQRQSQRIREYEPWKKAGVNTARGKKQSRKNALKHGLYSEETKTIRRYLKACRTQLKEIDNIIKN